MTIDEYKAEIRTLMNRMKNDPDVSGIEMLAYMTELAGISLYNIDILAGPVAPAIKETIAGYRR